MAGACSMQIALAHLRATNIIALFHKQACWVILYFYFDYLLRMIIYLALK